MMGVDILFMSYGGSHALMLKGVYSLLLNKGYNVKYLALTAAQDTIKEAKLPYDSINKFVKNTDDAYSVLDRYNLETTKSNLYSALCLDELESVVGLAKAQRLFKNYGRAIFCPTMLASEILEYYKPNILVTSNLVRLARGLLKEARPKNITTVYVEDMFMVASHPFINSDLDIQKLAHPPISIDYVITFADIAKCYIEHNLASNFIVNKPELLGLGNPNIEMIVDKFKSIEGNFSAFSNYDLYVSNKYLRESAVKLLLKFYTKSARNLIIKTHPLESPKYYKDQFKNMKNVRVISDKQSLYGLIKYSNRVFGTNSTALLEAKLVGKDIYCLNCSNETQILNTFIKTDLATNITNLNDLERSMKIQTINNNDSIKISLNAVKKISSFLQCLLDEK